MMIKTVLLAGFVISASLVSVSAAVADRPAGHIGVIVGAPIGMTADAYMDRSNRVFGDFGAIGDSLVLAGGWLHEFPSIIQYTRSNWNMRTLLGAGFHAHLTEGERLGVGPVFQQEIGFEGTPFSVFARVFPMLRIQESSGFNLNAGVGFTFSF